MTILIALASLYLALVFVKFSLMLGTAPVAIGTYHRKSNGALSKTRIGLYLIVLNLFVCFFGTPGALRREGFSFFGVYSNYSTMKQICQNFRG